MVAYMPGYGAGSLCCQDTSFAPEGVMFRVEGGCTPLAAGPAAGVPRCSPGAALLAVGLSESSYSSPQGVRPLCAVLGCVTRNSLTIPGDCRQPSCRCQTAELLDSAPSGETKELDSGPNICKVRQVR